MGMWLRYRRGERGTVFLLAMAILTVLLFLGASLIERAESNLARATADSRYARSFHLAEAGIHKALWELNQPSGWLSYQGQEPVSMGEGFFEVTVSPSPGERGVFTERLTVLSTGYMRAPGNGRRLPARIQVIATKEPKYFAYAVYGKDKVTIGNGTVTVRADSYDSTMGEYGPGNTSAQADVGTGSTAANAVEILPQGEVHGSITVGAGATNPAGCVSNKGLITGMISAAQTPNYLPSITRVPPGAIELGDVWLEANQELVLSEGTYHATDIDVSGNAKITCNGKVVIYVDESSDPNTPEIRIGGNGFVNTSRLPSNLVLYCLSDVVRVDITGNGTFYGGIYAPQAAITLGSGVVYGSLVGRTVTLNGATAHVHYDEALRDQSNPKVLMASWQQL